MKQELLEVYSQGKNINYWQGRPFRFLSLLLPRPQNKKPLFFPSLYNHILKSAAGSLIN